MADSHERMRKVVIWTAFIAVGALVIAGLIGLFTGAYRFANPSFGTTVQVDEQKSFAANGIEKLDVGTTSVSINLTDSADGSFHVHLSGRVSTPDKQNVPNLQAGVKGNTLFVAVGRKVRMFLGFYSGDLTLEVAVPQGYAGSLTVDSVSGRIEVAPHAFSVVEAGTTSGALTLRGTTAESIDTHSTSGTITMTGIASPAVSAKTTSGRITLESTAHDLQLHSVSGAIEVEASTAPAKVGIETTSGAVTLRLPASAQFALDLRSTSGAVSCEFPVTVATSGAAGKHELVGTVGGSDNSVSIRTVSGAIRIMK